MNRRFYLNDGVACLWFFFLSFHRIVAVYPILSNAKEYHFHKIQSDAIHSIASIIISGPRVWNCWNVWRVNALPRPWIEYECCIHLANIIRINIHKINIFNEVFVLNYFIACSFSGKWRNRETANAIAVAAIWLFSKLN